MPEPSAAAKLSNGTGEREREWERERRVDGTGDILFGHWDTGMAKCTAIGIYANGDIYVYASPPPPLSLPLVPFAIAKNFYALQTFNID